MEDLAVSENTVLRLPDASMQVLIVIDDEVTGFVVKSVPFEKLERWVASVREQIITVATEAKDWVCECGTKNQ